MTVVNVPPDGRIYGLGQIDGSIHVYDTNQPAAPSTTYDLTIIGVNVWNGVQIAPGHTDTYPGDGTAVYVCNHGPSRLQVLYVPAPGDELTPDDAGWTVVDRVPEAAAAHA